MNFWDCPKDLNLSGLSRFPQLWSLESRGQGADWTVIFLKVMGRVLPASPWLVAVTLQSLPLGPCSHGLLCLSVSLW